MFLVLEAVLVSIKKHARSYLTKAAAVLYYISCAGQNGAGYGGVPEWPKGADCKSVVSDFDGSNPSPSTNNCMKNPLL